MIGQILAYIGAAFVAFWGISHLFPTKNVVAGFGEISEDNRHIITMEWITEGLALIFIGAPVAVDLSLICAIIGVSAWSFAQHPVR